MKNEIAFYSRAALLKVIERHLEAVVLFEIRYLTDGSMLLITQLFGNDAERELENMGIDGSDFFVRI